MKIIVLLFLLIPVCSAYAQKAGGTALPDEDPVATYSFEQNKGYHYFPVKIYKQYTHCCNDDAYAPPKQFSDPTPGIRVTFESGAEKQSAFAIADGKVSKILHITGMQTVVIMRHGMYLSVYIGLDSVFVNEGDWILRKTEIGTIAAENEETAFEFQLWKGQKAMDPVDWLYIPKK